MKSSYTTFILFMISLTVQSQTTAIPDPVFEQVLIDLGIDSDGTLNGQVLTSDVNQITELTFDYQYINDPSQAVNLSGLEAFIALETLDINFVTITHIDLSQNIALKTLNLQHTGIGEEGVTSLDLSHNVLLEEFYGGNPGLDVGPFNYFQEIDFSNNPNIKIINFYNMYIKYINLKNGNNNPDMQIVISLYPWWMQDPDDNGAIKNTVCIEVDDHIAAQDDEFPYSDWVITSGTRVEYFFTDNLSNCTASAESFSDLSIKIYPNPAKDIIHFEFDHDIEIARLEIIGLNGKIVRKDVFSEQYNVSGLPKATYILRLFSNKGILNKKLIIQ